MPKQKRLTNDERIRAFSLLQGSLKDCALPRGEIGRVAKLFDVSYQAIQQFWHKHGGAIADPLSISIDDLKRPGRPDVMPKYDPEALAEALSQLPLRKRKTERDAAVALGVSKTTVHRLITSKSFRRHTSTKASESYIMGAAEENPARQGKSKHFKKALEKAGLLPQNVIDA